MERTFFLKGNKAAAESSSGLHTIGPEPFSDTMGPRPPCEWQRTNQDPNGTGPLRRACSERETRYASVPRAGFALDGSRGSPRLWNAVLSDCLEPERGFQGDAEPLRKKARPSNTARPCAEIETSLGLGQVRYLPAGFDGPWPGLPWGVPFGLSAGAGPLDIVFTSLLALIRPARVAEPPVPRQRERPKTPECTHSKRRYFLPPSPGLGC
jgi:hypothetical protein